MSDTTASATTQKSVNIIDLPDSYAAKDARDIIEYKRLGITSNLQAKRLQRIMLLVIGHVEIETDDPSVTTIKDILNGDFETVGGKCARLAFLIDTVIYSCVPKKILSLYINTNCPKSVTFESYRKMIKKMEHPSAWEIRQLLDPIEERRLPFQEMLDYTLFVADITSVYDATLKRTLLKYIPQQYVRVFEEESGTKDFEAYNNMEFSTYAHELSDFYEKYRFEG